VPDTAWASRLHKVVAVALDNLNFLGILREVVVGAEGKPIVLACMDFAAGHKAGDMVVVFSCSMQDKVGLRIQTDHNLVVVDTVGEAHRNELPSEAAGTWRLVPGQKGLTLELEIQLSP